MMRVITLQSCHFKTFPLNVMWHLPLLCYLLLGCFYFCLDADHLHQSIEYPRLLGYCGRGKEGLKHCFAYCPNPPTHPPQKKLKFIYQFSLSMITLIIGRAEGFACWMHVGVISSRLHFLFFFPVELFLGWFCCCFAS